VTWPPEINGPPAEGGVRAFPPDTWPSRAQLEYARTLIVVLLLFLALPYLIGKLATDPGAILTGFGRRLTEKGPPT
jgi:hypothetical protein